MLLVCGILYLHKPPPSHSAYSTVRTHKESESPRAENAIDLMPTAWKEFRRVLSFCLPSLRQRPSDINMNDSRKFPMPIDWIQDFRNLTDEEAIEKFHGQFEGELERLKNATSTIETNDKPTIGTGPDGLTPSKRIYGEDYPEVNRTCVSMLALKWLLKRDYHSFTAHQPPSVKLSEGSFDMLYSLLFEGTSRDDLQGLTALLVAVVVGDIGKDESLEKDVLAEKQKRGEPIEELNHDEVVYQAARLDMLDSLKLLRDDYRQDVVFGLKVGSDMNVPQLAQAENVPGSLIKYNYLKGRERAFVLKYLEIILDVSGAGGHVDSRSAIRMIEPVFQAYASCRSAIENIISGRKSLRQGYDQVLQQRGKLLDSKGVKSLHANVPAERALLRLMCLGRVDNRSNAELMISAFDGMRPTTRQHLIDGMSVDGIDDGEAIVLYYMPGLFAETFKITRESASTRKIEALRSLMRFMARVYNGSRPQPGMPGSIVVRNVGFVAKTIATEAFNSDPSILDKVELPWS